MKLKSKLGNLALEELNQDAAGEGGEVEGTAGADAAAADAGGEDNKATEGDAAPAEGGEAAGAADAGAVEGGEAAGDADGAEGGEAAGDAAPADAGDPDAQAADSAVAAVDAVGEEEPAVGESAEAGDTAEMISEEMAAADEAGEKAEATADDVENLQAAAESLTTTLEILQSSMQVGGLQPHGAMLLRQNLRMACESLDLSADAILLPAMEDAETPSSRMGMAGDAIDAVKKFVARIMETIAKAYKTFADFVAKLWTSLTDANKRLKARAEKLKSMVKGAEFNELITSRRVVDSARISGKIPDSYVEAAKLTNEAARFLCTASTYDGYLSALRAIEDGTKAEKTEADVAAAANKHLESMAKSIETKTQRLFVLGGVGGDRSLAAMKSSGRVRSLSLFGERTVVLWVPQNIDQLGGLATHSTTELKSSKETVSQVRAQGEKECNAICDEVIATCDFFIKNAGSKSVAAFNAEIKRHSDAIMTRVEAAIESSRKNSTNTPESVKAVSTWVQKAMYSLPQLPCTKIARAIPGSNAVLLDLVAASLKSAAAAPAEAAAA